MLLWNFREFYEYLRMSRVTGEAINSWLIELWFYVPLDTKQVISETFLHANLLAWYGKN